MVEKINLSEFPPAIGFIFMTVGQAAASANASGMTKEHFVEFCKGIWDTMMLNGPDSFRKVLSERLIADIDHRVGLWMHDDIGEMVKNKNQQDKKKQ